MTLARRVAVVAALAGAALALTAAPAASADPVAPPGWTSPSGGWVQFQISSYNLSAGDTVTLSRSFGPGDLLSAFSNWDGPTSPGGPPTWPSVWSASGVSLQRTAPCAYTDSSCSYTVTSATPGAEFWVAASDVDPATGQPINDPYTAPHGTISTPPPPPAPPVFSGNVTYTPGAGGAGGSAVFDATGSLGPGGTTPSGYRWTLTEASAQSFDCATAQCSPPAGIQIEPGHTYNVRLELLDGAGAPMASSDLAPFAVPANTPAPTPTPGPTPPVDSGGGTTGGGGGSPGVFARPVSRAPSSLSSGSAGAVFPTVVWLWRPEWFQSTPALPRTDGTPEVKGKTAVVVSKPNLKDDTNAAPWLAGVGAFGLIGLGFLFNRWRRVYRPSF